MIIVTGGAGFIGSNIVSALNARGIEDIIIVDDLADVSKLGNLSDLRTADYIDRDQFYCKSSEILSKMSISAVFHQGACSDTMAVDGREVMKSNYDSSKNILEACLENRVPLIYASSAAVYGNSERFEIEAANEAPLNVYAYSKYLFDRLVVRTVFKNHRNGVPQVVGMRYFNVYGPREAHKGQMASMVYQLFNQYKYNGVVRLFKGKGAIHDGGQQRDFVSVQDVVSINLYMFEHSHFSGIVNVGTGRARTFNDLALAVVNCCRAAGGEKRLTLNEAIQSGCITYFAMPADLQDRYQDFTEAALGSLRGSGYDSEILGLEDGVSSYVQMLLQNQSQPYSLN
ncbi:MAG: ADP-glyceromanno-heptose 6-epimerase [Acidiferrobacteraceae bacterium]|nr:ADP-glyceromanno-heptose 6-epimerase [Acidiferrobacteraceae bacterium]